MSDTQPASPAGTGEAPPRVGRGLLWRGLLAGVLICLMTAGAVSAAVLLQVDDILHILREEGRAAIEIPEIDRADAGKAQTLMILGSDRRFGDKEAGIPPRSDTIILVRLDPDKEVIAMTSIPRDLLVVDPEASATQVKINEAYANFGERGAVRAVKKLLTIDGKPFPINHVITVDFGGFRRAIDYIGCVYADIDRDYFNDSGRAGRLRRDRHRPRLPEALRQGRARLRALPPQRQRPRARRAPAGLPAPGAQREGDEGAARGRARARQPQEAGAGVRALLRPRQEPGPEEGGLQVRQDRALHGRQPGARGALPRDRRARQGQPRRVRGDARARPSRSSWTRRPRRPPRAADRADRGRDRGVEGAREAQEEQAVLDQGARGGARRGREPGDRGRAQDRLPVLLPDAADQLRGLPGPGAADLQDQGRARAASTTPTGSCSPRASSASTTGSRA